MNKKSDPSTFDNDLEYGHRLIVDWTFNIARGMRYPSKEARALLEETVEGDSFADLRAATATAPLLEFLSEGGDESWRRFHVALNRLQAITSEIPSSLPARRIEKLGLMLGLDRVDIRILKILLFSLFPGPAEAFLSFLMDRQFRDGPRTRYCSLELNVNNRDLPRLLGISQRDFRLYLDPKSRLSCKGLVEVDENLDIEVPDMLRRLYLDMDEQADVRSLLLGQGASTTELEWSDFTHLGQDRDDLAAVLQGAMERPRGVNVLLYGPPGMGKTSLARVAAQHVGLSLLDVGETDGQGGEPSARERLRELHLAQNLLEGDCDSVLLLDEMDDVLDGGQSPFLRFLGLQSQTGRNGSSRVWLHRLLENTPVPTVWIANDARTIDRAVLRRMTFALELRLPPPKVRASIWSRQLARHGVVSKEAEVRSLAEGFEAPPGVADGAILAGRLGGGDIGLVHRSVDRLSRLMGCGRPSVGRMVDFDPALINADLDPAELAERLVSGDDRHFSMCLQGPPGTGKSAYVRYLADQLGMEVLLRRASDLKSRYVGETEQNIALAFEMARDAGAFLVFDEVDSLLGSRQNAHYSWEVSQVNEMLTWMESHPLPFAGTTNFSSSLDLASARRFLFKIKLDFLNRNQSRLAFCKWFGREAPHTLDGFKELTPGDFEVVRRKARVMGQLDDAEELVTLLRAEVLARSGGHRAPVGFLGHSDVC